ncbi:MAG: hypothetical protein ACE10D_10935 [Planctomycetota bacterium]
MSKGPRLLSALLCCEDERVQQALERAGMRTLPGLTAGEALRTLEKEPLDVVISDVGTDPRTLELINALPGHHRRRLFVLLLGSGYRTGDRMQAWRESVNLIMNPDDLDDLQDWLRERMDEETVFYAPLRNAGDELRPSL